MQVLNPGVFQGAGVFLFAASRNCKDPGQIAAKNDRQSLTVSLCVRINASINERRIPLAQ
jgi:hypothetical protein